MPYRPDVTLGSWELHLQVYRLSILKTFQQASKTNKAPGTVCHEGLPKAATTCNNFRRCPHQRRMLQVLGRRRFRPYPSDTRCRHCASSSLRRVLRSCWQMIVIMGFLLQSLACAARPGIHGLAIATRLLPCKTPTFLMSGTVHRTHGIGSNSSMELLACVAHHLGHDHTRTGPCWMLYWIFVLFQSTRLYLFQPDSLRS
jgi:hypothetical protein